MYAIINLEGRLVNDPEFKMGKNNREFVTFRLAVNQQFGPQENASFFSCTGNEFIASRMRKAGLTKGRMLHVVGNITLREYTKQDGTTAMSADIGMMDWHFTGTKPKGETAGVQNTAPNASGAYGSQYGRQQVPAQYGAQQVPNQYPGQQYPNQYPNSQGAQYQGQQYQGQYSQPNNGQYPPMQQNSGQYPAQRGGTVQSEQYIGSNDDLPA